ncbi:hypothetical protein V8E54_000737 [Elaphomyces granulatus]
MGASFSIYAVRPPPTPIGTQVQRGKPSSVGEIASCSTATSILHHCTRGPCIHTATYAIYSHKSLLLILRQRKRGRAEELAKERKALTPCPDENKEDRTSSLVRKPGPICDDSSLCMWRWPGNGAARCCILPAGENWRKQPDENSCSRCTRIEILRQH